MTLVIILIIIIQNFSPENADAFAEKMSEYYGYDLTYEVRDIGDWMGATLWSGEACTTTVFLDDQFLWQYGDLWKGVLAHEWAHTLQGSKCENNERAADRIALDKLLDAKEFHAYATYTLFLRDKWGWSMEEAYYHFYGD
jgi:hypothetical protein